MIAIARETLRAATHSGSLGNRLPPMSRHVRGSFFADYVRMIRRRKDVEWSRVLCREDHEYVRRQVDPDGWYPMEVFERLGEAILAHNASGSLDAVRMWGHFSVSAVTVTYPSLIAREDPLESLMRLKVMRASLFDFHAFDIRNASPGHAEVWINYRMGAIAEEAACYQTMGFCEGVLSLAGANEVKAAFAARMWSGAPHTTIILEWLADY
jgi:hypothetical protein